MTASALLRPALLARLDGRALRRGLLAGAAWGFVVTLGLVAIEAQRCGVVCLDAAAITLFLSTAGRFVTIGPLAALGRA